MRRYTVRRIWKKKKRTQQNEMEIVSLKGLERKTVATDDTQREYSLHITGSWKQKTDRTEQSRLRELC